MSCVVSFVVVPLEAPRVVRHCPRCGEDRPFASSGRFRVNAQKRRLDVWLVRRCAACDSTWNQPVHERVTPEQLGRRLDDYHHDEPDVVAAAAFDLAVLRRHGRVEPPVFRVDRSPAVPPFVARVVLERPFPVRLDRVLATALGVSRARVPDLVDLDRDALRRDVVSGTEVRVRVYTPSDAGTIQDRAG